MLPELEAPWLPKLIYLSFLHLNLLNATYLKGHVQLRFGVQKSRLFSEKWSELEQTWQFDWVTDIITFDLL